ncbi:MAG TPA: hypothetical protein VJ826_00970 [Candidatus Polarisedimenticolaceae bacterium]|nr:hypothetical protein [Candidatus Polarisedimenticolaceae bacterium]
MRRTLDDAVNLPAAGGRWFWILAGAGVLGLVVSGLLAILSGDGGVRFYTSYLTSFVYFLTLGLGALFFVLIQFVTRAGWSVAVRRLAEAVAPNLALPMAPLVIPVLLGLNVLYPWSNHAVVEGDHLLEAKSAWLNVPFFFVRTLIYFGVWSVLSLWFHRQSVQQDRSGVPALTNRMEATSTAGLILFAFTLTFFSFDYIMSLTPHWYSTIFGVYVFAGSVLAFFAFLPLLAFLVQRGGALRRAVTVEHYHDLGKLVFAFTVFWAYIGFSQYMLMWYANLPEETVWYKARQTGGWTAVSVFLIFGHFLVPFLALMSRNVKRRLPTLVAGASWMLFMHYVDLTWLIRPAHSPGVVPLSLMDLATFVGIGGLFGAALVRRLAAHALVPVNDPRLHESVSFENF